MKIKMITSLYHSKLGTLNIGMVVDVEDMIANTMIRNKNAIEFKDKDETPVEQPVKKKTRSKKGE